MDVLHVLYKVICAPPPILLVLHLKRCVEDTRDYVLLHLHDWLIALVFCTGE